MRILVTGGAGYIGCLVVEELLGQDHEVVILDTCLWGSEGLDPVAQNITLIQGDCRNSRDILNALDGVQLVIHLAGIVGEPACKVNYKAHWTTNVECTRTLIDCCTDPDLGLVPDFIFLSSCSVYGNVKGLYEVVTEDTPTAPLSWYADGKLKSEAIIWERARRVPLFHPTILRLTTLFGWSHRPRLDLVSNLFAYQALKNGKITIFGDGQQYRSLIHVRDVARATAAAANAPRFMRDRKVFHVGEEANNRTVLELAEIVKQNLPQTQIDMKPGQPTDRRDYRIDCRRFKNVLGWQAQYDVERGIQEMIEMFRSQDFDWECGKYVNNLHQYV